MSQSATNRAAPDAARQLDIFRRMLRIERNDDATRAQIRRGADHRAVLFGARAGSDPGDDFIADEQR